MKKTSFAIKKFWSCSRCLRAPRRIYGCRGGGGGGGGKWFVLYCKYGSWGREERERRGEEEKPVV